MDDGIEFSGDVEDKDTCSGDIFGELDVFGELMLPSYADVESLPSAIFPEISLDVAAPCESKAELDELAALKQQLAVERAARLKAEAKAKRIEEQVRTNRHAGTASNVRSSQSQPGVISGHRESPRPIRDQASSRAGSAATRSGKDPVPGGSLGHRESPVASSRVSQVWRGEAAGQHESGTAATAPCPAGVGANARTRLRALQVAIMQPFDLSLMEQSPIQSHDQS